MHESRFLCNNGEETGVVQPDSDGKEAVENEEEDNAIYALKSSIML